MPFLWGKRRGDGELSGSQAAELQSAIESQITYMEDVIYGVALFFEGLNLLYGGQNVVLETYQKQFRNVIQADRDAVRQAQAVLDQVRKEPGKAALLRRINLVPCQAHSNPAEMEKRACVLIKVYNELFPNRPRSKEFTQEETFRLMEKASEEFAKPA